MVANFQLHDLAVEPPRNSTLEERKTRRKLTAEQIYNETLYTSEELRRVINYFFSPAILFMPGYYSAERST